MANAQLFLSTVSAEFRSYRDALRRDLDHPNVTVKVQEHFIATGTETLDEIDAYIQQCDAVIHLVGNMTGILAKAPVVAALRHRYPDLAQRLPVMAPFLEHDAPALPYTQWEAWLALYHGKVLIIAVPQDDAPRDAHYRLFRAQRAAQQEHLKRLKTAGRYPEVRFASYEGLATEMRRSRLHDILPRWPVKKPVNLPYLSIGALFKGREAKLVELGRSFGSIPNSAAAPVIAHVVNGLGGVGKSRLAVEYAWRRAGEYAAMFFVGADSREALQRNLAALCARAILDLPEQGETDEERQREAVLAWLRQRPGWLLILDNVDAEDAAAAAEALLPRLAGGHVLLTSRLANWGSGVMAQRLDELAPDAAADFLLARTDGKRRPQTDDGVMAGTLAEELGCLALALEQAGACIAQRRLSFTGYLEAWQAMQNRVLPWFDPRLKCLATALQIAFDQVGGPARRLLQRLAWLAPEPIPESLLEVPVPEIDAAAADPFEALIELESYSLVMRAADSPSVRMHPMVQQVTHRNLQRDDPTHAILAEALRWIDSAFAGDPQDVRARPVLDPLASHARAVATAADAAGLVDPTARLLNRMGTLLASKGRYAEVEPLYARALAIRENALGPDHPNVATSLNNLAELYRSQGAYAQAEPLYERALVVWEKVLGSEHPYVALALHNLALLYTNQGDHAKAEPFCERALAIRERVLGPEHPDVALSLNNLATLYQHQGAYAKAEPLLRRAAASFVGALGAEHPSSRIVAQNYAGLLRLMGGTPGELKGDPASLRRS